MSVNATIVGTIIAIKIVSKVKQMHTKAGGGKRGVPHVPSKITF